MNIAFTPAQVLFTAMAISAALIYLPFFVVGAARFQTGVDINNPRPEQDKLPAYAQRAYAAHQNSFEVFSLFVAAALMVYSTNKASAYTSIVAIVFVAARFLHSVFYIWGITPLRGLMWLTSMACVASLMSTSLTAFRAG